MEKILLIAGISAGVVLILVIGILLIRRSRRKKKLVEYFKTQLHKIIRNEALDKAINNYQKSGNRNYWLLKAIEINRFGEKEHFFNLEQKVSIGKEFRSSNFFILDEKADNVQCEITMIKEVPHLVNCSKNVEMFFSPKSKTVRKKKRQLQHEETVTLHTGNSVQFGETKIVFFVYNYNRGLI